MNENSFPFQDESLSFETRVKDLISRMTLEEKISQMVHTASAIPRLGVPAYNWWNECLHGVAYAGVATVFPQAIGMAASFDTDLFDRMAKVISDEARAKHHEFVRLGDRGSYKGLTFWSPNINIFRDPRWGRGQETFGEDPYLTGRLGVTFVKGLQGDDDKYFKLIATPKHFAVHSGPEKDRHHFNARVSPKDLRETYLPAFKECVKEGKAASVMGAYNRTNDEPCCSSKTLLIDILRKEWGFDGFVVSDCGAIDDLHLHHKKTLCAPESAAQAVRNGCELNCGNTYKNLTTAINEGLITESEIDTAVTRLFLARFRLGMFDKPESAPYTNIAYEVNDCEDHRRLSLQAARETIVLLKNEKNVLPLKNNLKSIAVIGPNADNLDILLGNYNGMPSQYVTPLQGIRNKVTPGTKVWYARGCALDGEIVSGITEAIAAVQRSEIAIVCLGLSPRLEGEERTAVDFDNGGDRLHINLPGVQQKLLEAVYTTGKPVVLVLLNGSPLAVNWAADNVPAIIEAWYPGEEGGTAIADVIFGDYNPGGRLPLTFVKELEDLPPFENYDMKGRTYRYLECEPLYSFGFGLSYTTFRYQNLSLSSKRLRNGESLEIQVEVVNTGKVAGDEVVQLYLSDMEVSVTVPIHQLRGFRRVTLQPDEYKTITFTLTPRDLALIDYEGKCILEPGEFKVAVGGRQPDRRSEVLGGSNVLTESFWVDGEVTELEY